MEIFRSASNPWGQEVLVGIAWDLMWAALIVGVVFVIGHAIYVRWIARPGRPEEAFAPSAGVPERIVRHDLASRLFHWLMSLAMFALLITAFFPVIGIRFPWVAIHWIAGVVLLVTILWHIVRAIFRQDPGAMWIGREDVREGLRAVGGFLRRSRVIAPKAAKYPLDHKLFHHAAAAVGLAAIVTGVLMMFRIDTPLLPSNPYMLSDGAWGAVYVLHGLSGVALIALVTMHVYFAIRPEKRWLTRSMVWGWIGREEYLLHHDPGRWVLNGGSSGQISEGSVAEASREAEPVAGA